MGFVVEGKRPSLLGPCPLVFVSEELDGGDDAVVEDEEEEVGPALGASSAVPVGAHPTEAIALAFGIGHEEIDEVITELI